MVKVVAIASASVILAAVGPAVLAAPLQTTDETLVEREPIFGHILNFGKKLLGFRREVGDEFESVVERDLTSNEAEIFEREFDLDLEEREPILPFLLGGALASLSGGKRDFDEEDLLVREPFLGGVLNFGKKLLGFRRDLENGIELSERDLEIFEREYDELALREPFLGGVINFGKKLLGFRRDFNGDLIERDFDLMEREFDELAMREPIFGHILNFGKKLLGFRRDLENGVDITERDLELLEREYSELDLEGREPFLPFLLGSLLGGRKRDLEDSGLEMRELYDEYDLRDFEIDELD